MFLLLFLFASLMAGIENASYSWQLAEFRPIDGPLYVVTSSQPLTWLEMRTHCHAKHPGFYIAMLYPTRMSRDLVDGCPNGTLVPTALRTLDNGTFFWDSPLGDLPYLPLDDSDKTKLYLNTANETGPYGAFVWPTTELRMVGNETKFTCAVCEMSRRTDVPTQGVYPPHNNSIFAYDLELVSSSCINDLRLVANGTDLTNKLLGDLAEAFNISVKSLRWHGAELNDDQKAVVHVYYDPPEGDNVEWDDYALWYDQYFEHKTVANFKVKMIKLTTECLVAKKFLSNVRRETYLTGAVHVGISNGLVTTRECYWDAANENSHWSMKALWEPLWHELEGGHNFYMGEIYQLDRSGTDYKRALRISDIMTYYQFHYQLKGLQPFYPLPLLTALANTMVQLHTMERPYASAMAVMSFSIPINLARVYMSVELTRKKTTELSHTKFVNVLVADIDASDPVAGLALSLPDGTKGTEGAVAHLNYGNMVPPNTSHIVVTVSESIAFSAKRLAIATFAAHLDLPNQTNMYDDSIDGWMAIVQVAFKRDDSYSGDVDKDFVDIAFKPVFHLPTVRGRCAEWIFATEEWFGDNCRILKSMRDGMLVCRCKNLHQECNITTNAYIIYGFDASLSTYLANNLTLVIVIIFVCVMSALGLLSVFLTAVVFPEWREDQGHKIFLQMTLALSVNLVLGFVNNLISIDTKSIACIGIGVFRHYSFLAMFFWMMILSGLQVKRLTTIAGAKATAHLNLKVSLIAWGLPLIPIVILLAWDTGFYKSEVSNRGYCYPEDVAFQATVQGPAGVILIANLVIFVIILNHIYGWVKCNKDVVVRKHTADDRAAQLRNLGNSIFVFFLFGFTWTFHFLSEEGIINSEFLFEFLFLITASFHLFTLALFFIVLDKKTRKLWKKALGRA